MRRFSIHLAAFGGLALACVLFASSSGCPGKRGPRAGAGLGQAARPGARPRAAPVARSPVYKIMLASAEVTDEAKEELKLMCNARHATACDVLDVVEKSGSVMPFVKTCDRGDGKACHILGYALHRGFYGNPHPAGARKLFKMACDKGIGKACFNLGLLHKPGLGGPKRYGKLETAIFEMACAAGLADGWSELGLMRVKGAGEKKNPTSARAAFRKGCSNGSQAACNNLAVMLELGKGGARDSAKAARLFAKACKAGNPMACVNPKWPELKEGKPPGLPPGAVRHSPDHAGYLRMALTAYEKRDFAEAARLFKRVLVEPPAPPETKRRARYWLGKSLYHLKQYDKALAAFAKVVEFGNAHRYYYSTVLWVTSLVGKMGEPAAALLSAYPPNTVFRTDLRTVRDPMLLMIGQYLFRKGNPHDRKKAMKYLGLIPKFSKFYMLARFSHARTAHEPGSGIRRQSRYRLVIRRSWPLPRPARSKAVSRIPRHLLSKCRSRSLPI